MYKNFNSLPKDPYTIILDKYKEENISNHFSDIDFSNTPYFLSLWKYVQNSPEQYYSKICYQQFLDFLFNTYENNALILTQILNLRADEINLALKKLVEVNELLIHENSLNNDDYYNIQYFETKIHPNYLKLIEGVFRWLISPLAMKNLAEKNKSYTNVTNIYDICNNIPDSYYEIKKQFNSKIRNSIAHGKVRYYDKGIEYLEEEHRYQYKEALLRFDNLVDCCNGIALAFQIFYLKNNTKDLKPLWSLYTEEIKSQLNTSKWEINDCLESYSNQNASQLVIYIKESFILKRNLMYKIFQTINLVESFMAHYDKYIINYISKYYLSGFVFFNGNKIRNDKEQTSNIIEILNNSLEIQLIWHKDINISRLPFFYLKIPLFLLKQYLLNKKKKKTWSVSIKTTRIFRYRLYSLIKCSVILNNKSELLDEVLIKKNIKEIINHAQIHAKKNGSIILRILPVGKIQVTILNTNFRERYAEYPGIIPELICVIEK